MENLVNCDEVEADCEKGSFECQPALAWISDKALLTKRHAQTHAVAISIGLVFSAFVIVLFIAIYGFSLITPEKAGQSGDFIAGTLGTVLGVVSVIALFITLKNDRLAREEEGFEDKYYQLLKLHRDNVAEIRIGQTGGRRVFVLLVREFRCILEEVRRLNSEKRLNLVRHELICASYYVLFYGVGPNSSRMLIAGLVNAGFRRSVAEDVASLLDDESLKKRVKLSQNFDHEPFEGHQSRLGHYFRHLYQMVTYIHTEDMRKFAPWLTIEEECEKKRQFIKTIRAQLSTHEQALLLLNSLTPLGGVWWNDDVMKRYGLVKNIPKAFFRAETEIDVDKHFLGGVYFEDDEICGASKDPWIGWPADDY